MLDVYRAQHIDAVIQQQKYILITFGKATTLDVAVGQLIHQHYLRRPGQHHIHVHLREESAFIVQRPQRQGFQLSSLLCSAGAAMCFNDTDHHVFPAAVAANALAQHGVRFAHAGRIAEKHLQPPARRLGLGGLQPVFRCLARCVPFGRHAGRIPSCIRDDSMPSPSGSRL